MRRNKGDQLAEAARLKALINGSLIDVSDVAHSTGISLPVSLSRGLWSSLVRTFPSARPDDYCSLEQMLSQLRGIVAEECLIKNVTLQPSEVLFCAGSEGSCLVVM